MNGHDTGLLVGTQPLLVMDVFEHAYLSDYRLKRNEYVESFFNVINWAEVEKRLAVCLKNQPAVGGANVRRVG